MRERERESGEREAEREGGGEWEKRTADLSEKWASVERKTPKCSGGGPERKKQMRGEDEKSGEREIVRGSESQRRNESRPTEECRCSHIIPPLPPELEERSR